MGLLSTWQNEIRAAGWGRRSDSVLVYAADNESLNVFRDPLVNGEVKETVEVFGFGMSVVGASSRGSVILCLTSDGFIGMSESDRL